jgi:hypothetical protein
LNFKIAFGVVDKSIVVVLVIVEAIFPLPSALPGAPSELINAYPLANEAEANGYKVAAAFGIAASVVSIVHSTLSAPDCATDQLAGVEKSSDQTLTASPS